MLIRSSSSLPESISPYFSMDSSELANSAGKTSRWLGDASKTRTSHPALAKTIAQPDPPGRHRRYLP